MSTFFDQILKETPKSKKLYISHSMDIAYLLREYLKANKIENQEFAKQLKKQPSVVSKWLSGNHNFTLETISEIEAATGLEIISVLTSSDIKVPDREMVAEVRNVTTLDIDKGILFRRPSQKTLMKRRKASSTTVRSDANSELRKNSYELN